MSFSLNSGTSVVSASRNHHPHPHYTLPPIVRPDPLAGRVAKCRDMFQRTFRGALSKAKTVEAPLRICPVGAHSDHQLGKVSGFAIDRPVLLTFAPSSGPESEVLSVNFGARTPPIAHDAIGEKVPGDWGNYLRGAIRALDRYARETGQTSLRVGIQGVLESDMPIGGLSSSAAVTLAYLLALEHVNGLSVPPQKNVALVLATENEYLGLNNGIMDQSIIVASSPQSLTVVDCETNLVERVPMGNAARPWEVLVIYSGLSRQLVSTPFNQRVAECREAARTLLSAGKMAIPEKPSLRQVPRELYEAEKNNLPDVLRLRAQHFFTEFERVERGAELWRWGDLEGFGELVTASGKSSIENFEAGSPELKSLYEILIEAPGTYGARFCGGGFKGCCLALIDPAKRDAIVEQVHEQYPVRHPEAAKNYSLHFCRSYGSAQFLDG
jgi:galacturonokinase